MSLNEQVTCCHGCKPAAIAILKIRKIVEDNN